GGATGCRAGPGWRYRPKPMVHRSVSESAWTTVAVAAELVFSVAVASADRTAAAPSEATRLVATVAGNRPSTRPDMASTARCAFVLGVFIVFLSCGHPVGPRPDASDEAGWSG